MSGPRRQAEPELVRLCAEVAAGRHPPTNRTVGGLLDRWLEQLEMLRRRSTS